MRDQPLCKVCLVSDIRMQSIQSKEALQIYKLLSNNQLIENGRSETLCYICYSQLQRCCKFSIMAQRSDNILRNLQDNGIEKTLESIAMLNKNPYSLTISIQDSISVDQVTGTLVTGIPATVEVKVTEEQESEDLTIKAETDNQETKDLEYDHSLKNPLGLDAPVKGVVTVSSIVLLDQLKKYMAEKNPNRNSEHQHTESNNKEETNATIEFNIEQIKMENEIKIEDISQEIETIHVEIDSSKNTEPSLSNKDKHKNVFPLCKDEDKPYSCNICNKPFKYKSTLTKHMPVHTGVKPYICKICDKTFAQKCTLTKHMLVHTGEKPFNCDVCAKAFAHNFCLTKHMFIHTGGMPYACSICDKSFAQKSLLAKHMRAHTGDKPFVCNICKKAFIYNSSLTTHMLVHSGVKNYACNICDKAFTYKPSLTYHMTVHSGEKPYSCNICDKAFIDRSALSKHMRVHTDEKPYVCNICDRAFSQKFSLTTHMVIHTGEKPYACNICGKAYAQKSNLATHIIQAHNREKSYSGKT